MYKHDSPDRAQPEPNLSPRGRQSHEKMKPPIKAFIAIYTAPVFLSAACVNLVIFIAFAMVSARGEFEKADELFTSLTHIPYFASIILTLFLAFGFAGILGYYMWVKTIFTPTASTKKIGFLISLGLIAAIPFTSLFGLAKGAPIYFSAYVVSCHVAGIFMAIEMFYLTARPTPP